MRTVISGLEPTSAPRAQADSRASLPLLRALMLLAASAVPTLAPAQNATSPRPVDTLATEANACPPGADSTLQPQLDTWRQEDHARALAARRQFVAHHNAQQEYAARELTAAMDNPQQWEQTMEQVRRQHAADLQQAQRLRDEYLKQRHTTASAYQQAQAPQQQ